MVERSAHREARQHQAEQGAEAVGERAAPARSGARTPREPQLQPASRAAPGRARARGSGPPDRPRAASRSPRDRRRARAPGGSGAGRSNERSRAPRSRRRQSRKKINPAWKRSTARTRASQRSGASSRHAATGSTSEPAMMPSRRKPVKKRSAIWTAERPARSRAALERENGRERGSGWRGTAPRTPRTMPFVASRLHAAAPRSARQRGRDASSARRGLSWRDAQSPPRSPRVAPAVRVPAAARVARRVVVVRVARSPRVVDDLAHLHLVRVPVVAARSWARRPPAPRSREPVRRPARRRERRRRPSARTPSATTW